MEEKNYTEVLINGNVYTLGGAEDPEYLQKVAAYINEKVAVLKAQPGFTRQNKDYQEVMIYLNLADDYFKTLQEAMMLRAQKDEMEKEIYSLKHELIGLQMTSRGKYGLSPECDCKYVRICSCWIQPAADPDVKKETR